MIVTRPGGKEPGGAAGHCRCMVLVSRTRRRLEIQVIPVLRWVVGLVFGVVGIAFVVVEWWTLPIGGIACGLAAWAALSKPRAHLIMDADSERVEVVQRHWFRAKRQTMSMAELVELLLAEKADSSATTYRIELVTRHESIPLTKYSESPSRDLDRAFSAASGFLREHAERVRATSLAP